MKLKTSFFNPTVLRKDVTRFAPLWGLYTVFMLMTLFLIWANENEPARFASIAPNITQAMGAVNFVYAGLCALLLFGDLFTSKMAGMLHAMPMRREGWFLTHLCAGMLFCAVPNAVGALLACIILQQYCYLAFVWLGVMLLQFLFFFGVGAFSAQCAGNKLGAIGIYALVNFLAVLVTFLVVTFYQPVLYGVVIDTEKMLRYSPVVNFCMSPYMRVQYDNMRGAAEFMGFAGTGWGYLFVAVAVGLVFMGSAVVLYRRRQLESAGDLISFRPAAPVFLVIYTLCCGAAMYFLAELFGTEAEYLFLVLGFAIGFFTGHMLLEKKVNVFQGKKWLGFGALTAAFFLTIAVATIDPLGISRYVPREDQIQKVHISPYAAQWYLDEEAVELTDSQDIWTITDIHKALVKGKGNAVDEDICLNMRYYLKDGRTVNRKYYMDVQSNECKSLKTFFTDFSYVTGQESPEQMQKNMDSIVFHTYNNRMPMILFCPDGLGGEYWGKEEEQVKVRFPESLAQSQIITGLLAAIEKDCQAGNMAQQWDFHQNEESTGNFEIVYKTGAYGMQYRSCSITVFESCTNTVKYLEALVEAEKTEQPEQTEQEDSIAGVEDTAPEGTEPVLVESRPMQ